MTLENENKDKIESIEADKEDQEQEEIKPNPNPITNEELIKLFKPESDQITYNNMAKLTKQDSFLIGDKTFNRRRLKPKQLLEFTRAYEEVTAAKDSELEQKLISMEKAAMIALEEFTKEDFENTDTAMLENVLAACFLITKGFRQV